MCRGWPRSPGWGAFCFHDHPESWRLRRGNSTDSTAAVAKMDVGFVGEACIAMNNIDMDASEILQRMDAPLLQELNMTPLYIFHMIQGYD